MKKLLIPLKWLMAALFLVEEALWDWTAKLMARISQNKLIHTVESYIASLSPYWALLVFCAPMVLLEPAKIYALAAISSGKLFVGVMIFIIAKVVGFALFSRIFNLTKPALLQIGWFCSIYDWVMKYRNKIHAYLDSWEAYQNVKKQAKEFVASIKMRWYQFTTGE